MKKVSIVKCNSYDEKEVFEAVKNSVRLIGGLNIKDNSNVLIKPNLLAAKKPEQHITTHPAVIRAIVKLLKEKNCKIYIGDSPGLSDSLTAARVCGMLDICEQEKVEFIDFKDKKTYFNEKAKSMKRFELCDILDKVDYIVNVPKLKTHVMMGVTMAIKNTFGFIVGLNKSQMHLKLVDKDKFANMLVDLNEFVNPHLNIIDGIVGMEGNGPSNGNLKKVGVIGASYDSLALDITMCKLIGHDPLKIFTNKVALERRGKDYLNSIEVVGEKEVRVNFKPSDEQPVTFIQSRRIAKIINRFTSAQPVIDVDKCKACGQCIKICPAKTISYKDKKAWINR
ncbi:MAG: DUF362 domain-containing protein, partial [Nanoarchaeota archaeon]